MFSPASIATSRGAPPLAFMISVKSHRHSLFDDDLGVKAVLAVQQELSMDTA